MEFLGLLTDVNKVVEDHQKHSVSVSGVASALRDIKSRIVMSNVSSDEAFELTMTIELFATEMGIDGYV